MAHAKQVAIMVQRLSKLSYRVILAGLPDVMVDTIKQCKRIFISCERNKIILDFLEKCRNNDVLPKFITLPKVKRHDQSQYVKDLRNKVLSAEIVTRTNCINSLEMDLEDKMELLSPIAVKLVQNAITCIARGDLEMVRNKYVLQLSNLCLIENGSKNNSCVLNLSSYQLTKSEVSVLNNGFNMCWPNNNKNSDYQIKTELESLFSQIEKTNISSDTLNKIGTKLKSFAYKICDKKNNISLEIRKQISVLKNLAKNKDLYVCKFDKGNGVFIDNKTRYIEKMKNILSDSTKFSPYIKSSRIKNDPFIVAQNNFNDKIKKLYKDGKISEHDYGKIRSVGSQPARLYGLSKVHKDKGNPPYRPVLSMPNAYCTNLSKWLDNILKEFIPQECTVKDSFAFCDLLKNSAIDASKCFMVSFDVKSLFTNIPVHDTIKYICDKIPQNKLPIDKATLMSLLELACTNILFSFDNKLYVQHDGMSMGSNLGPTMAAFTMSMIEDQICNMPLLYKRYVDDVFAIFKTKFQARKFLNTLNLVNKNIQFTIEEELDNSLCFLDTNVQRVGKNFEVKWHLKTTNTGVYIPRSANCPLVYKTAAIRGLIYRAYKISSTYNLFEESFIKIKSIFIKNGYHPVFVDKIRLTVEKQISAPKIQTAKPKQLFLSIPYSKLCFEHSRRLTRGVNTLLPGSHRLNIAFKTTKTNSFFKNKDVVPNCLRSNIIYRFKCGQCDCSYIGETTRHFDTRITEHINGKSTDSEVSYHEHPPQKDNFSIIMGSKRTKITEALVLSHQNKVTLLNDFSKSFPLRLFPPL